MDEVEFLVFVRHDGRITIPKEVRAALKIEDGELIRCRISKMKLN